MDVWCRNLSCPDNEGELYRDGNGAQGCCKLKEIQIDKEGKCKNDGSK